MRKDKLRKDRQKEVKIEFPDEEVKTKAEQEEEDKIYKRFEMSKPRFILDVILTEILLFLGLSALILIIASKSGMAKPYFVCGRSMENTYYNGDLCFVRKEATYNRNTKNDTNVYKYGDIVVFYTETDKSGSAKGSCLIKRVIGVPGDKLTFYPDHVYLNDTLLLETYVKEQADYTEFIEAYAEDNNLDEVPKSVTVTVDDDHYFVMGDNRNNSDDSRSWPGQIKTSQIYGKVKIRIPLGHEVETYNFTIEDFETES